MSDAIVTDDGRSNDAASTTSRAFFEAKYAHAADPWCFASNPYEQQRYQAIVAHVPFARYDRVFEPGCSVGELTVLLAARCGQVIATDVADAAVARARERCAPCPNATVTRATLPDEFPEGDFDLIVFSEIGYYFDEPVLQAVATNLESHLRGGGRIIAAHWIGHSPDHVLSGDEVHAVLHEQLELRHVAHERHASSERDGFVLDVWDTV